MFKFTFLTAALAAAGLLGVVAAHPNDEYTDHTMEIAVRDSYVKEASQVLALCGEKVGELNKRTAARRMEKAAELRKVRGIDASHPYIHRRDLVSLQKWEKLSHDQTSKINDPSDPQQIFGSTPSCILTPEEIIGPMWVSGELDRTNIVDGAKGVALHLEMQFININTCEPANLQLVDVWATDALGRYSGVEAVGQAGLNTNFQRGIHHVDADGTVGFDMIFPGHYGGRSTHIHVFTKLDATRLDNGTWTGGTATHIGQLYFDDTLRETVEASSPYKTNTKKVTSNDDDCCARSGATPDYDPFVDYVYLGSTVTDGIYAWKSIGINNSANHDAAVHAAGYHDGTGNHDVPSSKS